MKASKSTIVSIFSLLVICMVPCANSTSALDSFLQCTNGETSPASESFDIYTPDNSSFTSVLQAYVRNLRYMTPTTPKPLAIVAATNPKHVAATVVCAKKSGLQIRIRSGGHDYDGLSYVSQVPFVVLDMSYLRDISINISDETAWVQSGATLGELYYKIANTSKVHAFPAGVCFTLGVGGHFSGGGYGNMIRKYGLSSDNIVDALVVDANGKLLDRAKMGEDLFWAIRGGGAASFCVVVSWKIKLVRVPETVTVFKVTRTLDQGATDLVCKWQQVADKIDNDLFIRVIVSPVNGTKPGTKTVSISFVALFLGQTDRLLQLMDTNFPELGLKKQDCIKLSWIESTLFYFDSPKGTPIETMLDRNPKFKIFLKRKSDYVKLPISKIGLEAIWKAVIESEKVGMQWNPYGGVMHEIPSIETPFPHRAGNIFKIQYVTNWMQDADTPKNLNLTQKLFDAMTPYVSKHPREAFLNYRDIDIGTNQNGTFQEGIVYGIKYFKENFPRLVNVKTKVDPDNFFRYEQSIPTRPVLKKMMKRRLSMF